MGRFKHLVDSSAGIEGFRAKYDIPQGLGLQYCPSGQVLTNKEMSEVDIPMIAFIEEGMTLPICRITKDYLLIHRLCLNQCAPNLFRVLGSVDALNNLMGLRLTWHDVVHVYECHSLASVGYYLKSHSNVVRLISCLPESNKGLKDDYLVVSREWHNDIHCPIPVGKPSGVS